MKKIVKKQLKEDEFVHGIARFVDFLKIRNKEVLTGLAIVAAFAILFFGVKLIQAGSVRKQSEVIGQMIALRQDLDGKPENVAKLEKMTGDGKPGRTASLLLATYWVEKADLGKARDVLEKMKTSSQDLQTWQAQDLLGQVYALQKEYDKALGMYQKLEEERPADYGMDVVLFHKAEALAMKGEKTAALDLFKKIQADHPQSLYGQEAAAKARKLESGK